jgi:hypothetical protein
MFRRLVSLTGDLGRIAVAPVSVAVDLTAAVVKPVADAAEQIADTVSDLTTGGRPKQDAR